MKSPRTSEDSKPSVLTLYWDQRPLNIVTIGLLLASPFWMASLIMRGLGGLIPLFLIMLGLVVTWAFVDKIAFRFDPETQSFMTPDNDIVSLSDIDRIELDGRDLYFIPRRRHQTRIHLKARAWVIAPSSEIFRAAKSYNWPIRDVTRPLGRILVWFMP
jgi:hypothetical protein